MSAIPDVGVDLGGFLAAFGAQNGGMLAKVVGLFFAFRVVTGVVEWRVEGRRSAAREARRVERAEAAESRRAERVEARRAARAEARERARELSRLERVAADVLDEGSRLSELDAAVREFEGTL